jgi:release factor glutamine methyltransferase
MESLHQIVVAARERLSRSGLPPDTAAIDAEVLARHVLGWDRARYLAERGDPPPSGFAAAYEPLLARRAAREPVAQILGRREFWGRDFEVSRDVLTPRPETEIIVEEALDHAGRLRRTRRGAPLRLVDVGTGSGCLAITLALEVPGARVVATDISFAALTVARRNAGRLGAAGVGFVETSLLEGLAPGFDVIVSNPPYVPLRVRRALSPDVRDYEPHEALFGGDDGLDVIRNLLNQAASALAPDGVLIMEFGAGQDDEVRALVAERPDLDLLTVRADLQGIDRVAVARRPCA